jgi:hypothetical protein
MEQHSKALFKLPRADLVKILKAHGIIGHSKLKKREIVQEMLRLCETPEGGALSRSIKKYTMKAHEAGKSMASGRTSRAQALKGGALQDEFQNSEFSKYDPERAKYILTRQFLPPTHSETDQETILYVKPTDPAVLANYMELPYITRDSKGNFLKMNKLYIHNDYVDRLEQALSKKPSIVQSGPHLPEFVSGIDLYYEYEELQAPRVAPRVSNKIVLFGESHGIYSREDARLSGGSHVPVMRWINGLKQRHNIVAFGEEVKRLKEGIEDYIVTDDRVRFLGKDLFTKLYFTNSFEEVDKLLRDKLSALYKIKQSQPLHKFYPEVLKWTKVALEDQIEFFLLAEQPNGTFTQKAEDGIKAYITAYITNVIDFLRPDIINILITDKVTDNRIEALRDLFMLFCDVFSLLYMYKIIYSATSPVNIIIMNGQRHTEFLYKYLFNVYFKDRFVSEGGQIRIDGTAGKISAVNVSQIQWV